MGVYDTVYAELDCPACGRKYWYAPMSWEEAERRAKENKQRQLRCYQKCQTGEQSLMSSLQSLWASMDGLEDVGAWISQLDNNENIEAQRISPHLGLAGIQTKAFDCVLEEYYVGDQVPGYGGKNFIPGIFRCSGCSSEMEWVFLRVWIEIEHRRIRAVHTRDPETREPEKSSSPRVPEQDMDQRGLGV
ncbi:MAG: hypothetical protein R6U51_08295 [Anaerolineales bacterium]